MRASGTSVRLLSLLWALVLCTASICVATASENLLVNPQFVGAPDSIPHGWVKYGGAAVFGENLYFIPDEDNADGWILVVDQVDRDTYHGLRTVDQPAEVGVEYKFSADVRVNGGQAYILLAFLDKGKAIIDYTRVFTTNREWFRLEAIGEAPAGTKEVRLYLYTLKNAQGTYQYRNPKFEIVHY